MVHAPADGSAVPARLFYVAGEEVRRLRITAGEPAGVAETVLRWGGEISGLVPLAGGQLVAVVAGDELTKDNERRQAEGDDVMVWSERAARRHWLWHRLRLLDLASGELTLVAGLAGRHVVDVAQQPGGGGPPAALFAEGLDTALYRLDPAVPSFERVTGLTGQAAGLTASDEATAIAVLTSTAYSPPDVHAGSPGRSWAEGPFSLLTMVHGGPYGRWADELMAGWWSWGQWLAAAGFAVFHPHNWDLSTSTSQPGEDGSKPCSISQRMALRLRSDHHARITSRSTSVP